LSPRNDSERLPNRFDIERAVEASDLAPIGRHIILVLCGRMMQGSTVIPPGFSPSLTQLARATGWDRRTIMRYLNILEAAGWLIRRRPDPGKARTEHIRTAYVVTVARDTASRGVGAGSAQARDSTSRGLGTSDSKARGTLSPNQIFSDQRTDQSGNDGDLAELVIKQLHLRTGVTVGYEWAQQTTELLLARPGIKNPRAYIIRTITTDPRPERWLPTPEPPAYQREEPS
jgi:hypothetical protein